MTAHYLADKSELVRFGHPAVADVLQRQLEDGLIATCDIINREVLPRCTWVGIVGETGEC